MSASIVKESIVQAMFFDRKLVNGKTVNQRADKISNKLNEYCKSLNAILTDLNDKKNRLKNNNLSDYMKENFKKDINALSLKYTEEQNKLYKKFEKEFNLSPKNAEKVIEYFADDREEQIYKWCLQLDKKPSEK